MNVHDPATSAPSAIRRPQRYRGLAAFYQDNWKSHMIEQYRLGSLGCTLLNCEQTCGDWSDPAVPELVIGHLASEPVGMTADFGAGLARHSMLTNSFVVIPRGYATTFLMDDAHRAHFLAIPYRRLFTQFADAGDKKLPKDGDFGVVHSRVWKHKNLTRLIYALAAEARAGSPNGHLASDGIVLQIIAVLLGLNEGSKHERRLAGLSPWQMKRVKELIEDNISANLSLEELATSVGLSAFHFCRAFARSTGLPPHQWRLKRRTERAAALLKETPLPISEVALELGFATSQHFASTFKHFYGVTPSQFRAIFSS